MRTRLILSAFFALSTGFAATAFATQAPAAPAAKSETHQSVQAPAVAGKVNLNTADADVLQTGLIGIGAVKAQAIVEYRQANGPFASVDELLEVKGIGAATLEKNRDRLSLN